ncbi:cation:proton antiporter [Chitinispirillales bacterium ANBcel5]|uniref:cation:proton antiporter n=1 Tax=Cellulosispirillum alkaliphilum TaxID=3039283 RepID=UPI002A580024|nr:cation:proton antiporter [Chitinispirillales bacterium ANBcel5]
MPFNILVVLILMGGWLVGKSFSKAGLPSVLGMVVWGLVIGFLWSDYLPPQLSAIEPFLKSMALIIILLRAGLGIKKSTLKKTGVTALLMAFIPCIVEGTVLTVLIHYFFGFQWPIAGLTAFMLAAVSPAVVVPSMLDLKDKGYGKKNDVPTIVLAGASIDDVFAITVFTVFLQSLTANQVNLTRFLLSVPFALVTGIISGIVIGFTLVWLFRRKGADIRATEKTLILLMIAVMLVQIGDWLHMASLLGVMTIGFILLEKQEKIAHELSFKLSKMWVFAEIVLFVLIGISVDPLVALDAGSKGLLIIFLGVLFRAASVLFATSWSELTFKERLFCAIAYTPKATVQAALGGVALSMGIEHGETILALAVLSIMITAPLGLIGIRHFGKHLLSMEFSENE